MNLQIAPQETDRNRTMPPREGGMRAARIAIGAVLLIAVLGGYYAYTHMGSDSAARAGRNAAAPVRVAPVAQRDMQVIERTIGTVVANSVVSVTARVQGQLVSVHFKEGQLVKKGDLLFEIDPSPYQAALDSAEAVLLGAKTNADRSASLLKQNAIAPQANDNAQATYLQAKANAEAARLNLQFTQIRSPIDGKTGPILLQPGNLVSVNGTTTPLVTIAQIQPIKISFALSQAELPRIQAQAHSQGLVAHVDLHNAGGGDLSAPVDFISNAVNATSGTIELRATFPNLDSALVPGQLVDVTVQLGNIPGALVVPREAVNIGPDGQFVYVVTQDGIAEMRPVKLRFDDGANDAVEGNLQDGDRVIIDGQLRVIPGAKVSIGKAQPGIAGAGAPQGGAGRAGGRRGGRRGGNAEGSPAPG